MSGQVEWFPAYCMLMGEVVVSVCSEWV